MVWNLKSGKVLLAGYTKPLWYYNRSGHRWCKEIYLSKLDEVVVERN